MKDLTHPNLALYLPLWKRDGAAFRSNDAYGRLCTVTNAPASEVDDVRGRVFDGTTSKITCASDPIGILPITIATTIKLTAWGGGNAGRILDNGYLKVLASATNSCLNLYSDGVTKSESAVNSISLNKVYRAVFTRTAGGLVTSYINGLLSRADQNSGTPAPGNTLLCIGTNIDNSRTFAGFIQSVAVYTNVIWATPQVAYDYQEYKARRR